MICSLYAALVLSLLLAKSQGQGAGGCSAPLIDGLAADLSIYSERSSALQIFDAPISCSGYLVSWNFISTSPFISHCYLSVWRMVQPAAAVSRNEFIYRKVGETKIENFAASPNAWNSYGQFQPFPVEAGDVIGIFYDNYLVNQSAVGIPHADQDTSPLNIRRQLNFYRTFVALTSKPNIDQASE